MPGGANPAPKPRVRTFSFRAAVLESNARLPKHFPVYPFSKGKQKRDSGPEAGIYALRQYAGTLYADLIANQATLTQETIDGFTKALRITPSAADGQAQLIVSTVKGSRYSVTYQYYTAGVDLAGRVVIYDGDQRGFGANEPNKIIPSPWLRAVTRWAEAEATFVALSATSTIAMEANYTDPSWWRSISVTLISGTTKFGVQQRSFFDGTLRTLPDGSIREVRTKRV